MKLKPILPFDSFNNLNEWKTSNRLLEKIESQENPNLDEVKEDIDRALAKIMGRFPFFGEFIFRFRILYVPWDHPDIKTMATDGKNIFINPGFAAALTDAQTIFILCHEVLHNVMMHFAREKVKGVDDHQRANVAMDLEINPMLVDEGLLTADEVKNEINGLYDEKYLDMPWEEIYDKIGPMKMPPLPPNIQQKMKNSPPGSGDQSSSSSIPSGSGSSSSSGDEPTPETPGSSSPGNGSSSSANPKPASPGGTGGEGIGGVIPEDQSIKIQKELGVPVETASEKDAQRLMEEAQKNSQKLNSSSSRGTGKGLIKRAIDRFSKPQVNWKNELRRIIGKMVSKNEEYFGKKKHLYKDEYFYGDRPFESSLKTAVMTVDTSGSMGDDELKIILGEIYSIIRSKKIKKTDVVYFDHGIQGIDVVKNPPHFDWEKATGGGGTSFIEPVEYIQKKNKLKKLELAVFCTDGYGDQDQLDPNPAFAKKFIWLIIDNPNFVAPFGKVVHITTKNS